MSVFQSMRYESASIRLHIWPNGSVTISNLFSHQRRLGHATELMKQVVDWADSQGYNLQLAIGSYGHPIGPDNEALAIFYEQFGFTELVSEKTHHQKVMFRHFDLAQKTSGIMNPH